MVELAGKRSPAVSEPTWCEAPSLHISDQATVVVPEREVRLGRQPVVRCGGRAIARELEDDEHEPDEG